MTNYLLDANHLSPLVTPSHPLRDHLLQQHRVQDHFSIAVPALTEMLYGIRTLPRAQRNLQEWQRFSGFLPIMTLTKGMLNERLIFKSSCASGDGNLAQLTP